MATQSKKENLKFLAKLSPTARAGVIVGTFAVVVMVGAAIFAPPNSNLGKTGVGANESTLAIPQTKDNSNEKIAADQLATQNKVIEQDDSIKALRDENARLRDVTSKPPAVDIAVQNRLDKLTADIEQMRAVQADAATKQLPLPIPSGQPGKSLSGADLPIPSPLGGIGISTEEANKIRIIGGGAEKQKKAEKLISPIPKAYLPAGTFFEAVLLNGMDAPTNPVAIKNPVPALARIKTDATLPNLFKHDVKECFVLMAGYGSLASERAVIRLESLSCTAEDGKVLEAKLDGYIVGEDGRVGMRGRLVSKQGQLIAQSLTAGIFAGFGTAITPTATPGLNLNGGTSYALPSVGSIATTAVGKGFSDSATTVSKFYLEMASQMTPIVEIDAGRKITLILTKGIEVK